MKKEMPPLDSADLAWLLDHSPVGVVLQDAAGKITWVNETFEAQVGIPAAQILGKTTDDLPLELADVQVPEGTAYHLAGGMGRAEWLACHVRPLGEQASQSVSYFQDITEAERARIQADRLRQATLGQVSTDEATGLLSRRAVLNQLEAQVSRSRRYENPLSAMLIRLRSKGQQRKQTGDQGVVAFGRMLRDQTRWPDIIGRWDEQEFLLVLPETPADAAEALKIKILEGLEAIKLGSGRESLEYGAEFGIAGWHKRDDPQALVEKAIQALDSPNTG